MTKNIVIVTMDSVRADHTTLLGYDTNTTPELKRISEVNFNSARAAAPCTPHSLPSMLTGQLPMKNGLLALDDVDTIPSYLSEAGYQTCLVNSNIQIPRFSYHSDFDDYIDFTNNIDEKESSYITDSILEHGKRLLDSGGFSGQVGVLLKDTYHRFNRIIQPHEKDAVLIDAAIDWVNKAQEPYFLWVHLMDTHYPYEFDANLFELVSDFEYDKNRYARLLTRAMTHTRQGDFIWQLDNEERQYLKDAYDASIRQADKNIARLTEAIDLSNTLLLCTSDHGEELWEHGHFGHAGRSSIPRDMTLYEEVLHVPLVIAGDVPSNHQENVNSPVSLTDIAPTVLQSAGVEIDEIDFSGQSMLNGHRSPERTIIAQSTSPGDPVDFNNGSDTHWMGARIIADQKVIADSNDATEIYELPDETSESSDALSDEEMASAVREIKENVELSAEQSDLEIGDDTEKRLKELGYLG
ncbi:hypothetical protein Har1130_06770 [Haloarcula sp. CBA1130]|uniref:sulfatase n=1 Tax=unclassified Haloarcula TaxID=2624677 RepID=UPI001246708A|nr:MULTISPECIES: sulfatase [unclassified Haloarcula]KAA9397859.1 hypothetical protein Har1129_06370 [Haloarcula sp. CBA1129]KAA9402453.1 hypothetical protein Har1130_06770 [Haloarcula sp. CBA1130]